MSDKFRNFKRRGSFDYDNPHCKKHSSFEKECVMCQAYFIRSRAKRLEDFHKDWEKRNFGMPSLRNQFAMTALQSITISINSGTSDSDLEGFATVAFKLADALLLASQTPALVGEEEEVK